MPTPEELARQDIDRLLTAAGWLVQDRADFNRNAGPGVAVREFALPAGEADYLLFVDGKAAGLIEAKPQGATLSGVEDQTAKYLALPDHLPRWVEPIPFLFESTGAETFFRDLRDPKPRARRVFAFFKPDTLRGWLNEPDTLRARLARMPALADAGLRRCQVDAVAGLEKSLAADHPRALIQMATGAGKTYTACNFIYRLIKHGGARRVLFLVDRGNLGIQAEGEFRDFHPADDGRAFTSIYNIQRLASNVLDRDAKVVITTIQRLYSMLCNEEEFDAEREAASGFEANGDEPERSVAYTPRLPIESFDFVVTDECHRSIYKVWRQVLEYFDAHLIGLTATPSAQTLGFFNQNLVTEYPYERSVVDGVNVGYEIYRIKTRVGEAGSLVPAKTSVGLRDKRTRKTRWQELDTDLAYTAKELDRSVTAPDQIRTVLKAYRNKLFTELFPGRTWVPKTLIFAKDDSHAEDIVRIAREVFEEGGDFCKKITYRVTGVDPDDLIKEFRTLPLPRIAVTVDMIATGTDIKPLEVVVFMRDVRSGIYYEQMKGRGARSIPTADLLQVTPDAAQGKGGFVLIDAVGVTESAKQDTQSFERKKSVGFDKLLELVAQGKDDDDTLLTLAGRLARLDRQIDPAQRDRIRQAAGGLALRHLAVGLFEATDADTVFERAAQKFGAHATAAQREEVQADLKRAAIAPFDHAQLRRVLMEVKKENEIVIDEVTQDAVTYAGYDFDRAREMTTRFADFIAENKDRILALQILFSRPYGQRHLTYAAVQELAAALKLPPWHLEPAQVWRAYQRLEASRVRGANPEKLLTNLISLVRFAAGKEQALEEFDAVAERRFQAWLEKSKARGLTPEQIDWLDLIKDHIAANAEINLRDFQDDPDLADRGGLVKARQVFGDALEPLLTELCEELVA